MCNFLYALDMLPCAGRGSWRPLLRGLWFLRIHSEFTAVFCGSLLNSLPCGRARFASGCCCGAAAAIEAGGWDAQSVPGERRAAWVAWQAKCVRTRALQRNAMQSVLDAAAT